MEIYSGYIKILSVGSSFPKSVHIGVGRTTGTNISMCYRTGFIPKATDTQLAEDYFPVVEQSPKLLLLLHCCFTSTVNI